MNSVISVMQRYEVKYLLSPSQGEYFIDAIKNYMTLDDYGLTSILSLYYDTPEYYLIRSSIDSSGYKEKIRLRSYSLANEDSPVFLELKRKADGIVYKRRIQCKIADVEDFFCFKKDITSLKHPQIADEINYFRNFYKNLAPAALIIYDRRAYFQKNGDLRLTIDANPRFRLDNLDLTTSTQGKPILPDGWMILEVKVQESIPIWLSEILSYGGIYKNSFSKYGEVYKHKIFSKDKGVILDVENF